MWAMCCTCSSERHSQVAGRPCAHQAAAAHPAGPMRIRLLLTLLAAASAAQSGTEASGPQHVKARRWIWGLLQQPAGRALCGVDDCNSEEAHVLCTAEVGMLLCRPVALSGTGLLAGLHCLCSTLHGQRGQLLLQS